MMPTRSALVIGVVLTCALASIAAHAEERTTGVQLPLYEAAVGDQVAIPSMGQVVGHATVCGVACGWLRVDVRVDAGDPCTVFDVCALVDGKRQPEELVQITSNQTGQAEGRLDLEGIVLAEGADCVEVQVIVQPWKGPAGEGYATEVRRIELNRPCTARPAGGQGTMYPPAVDETRRGRAGVQPAAAQPCAQGQVIAAQGFQLVDATGRVRATLQLDGSGNPQLAMWDNRGVDRMLLGVDPDGAVQMDLKGGTTQARTGLAVLADGTVVLHFVDVTGQPRGGLAVQSDGAASVSLVAPNGQIRLQLALSADGTPMVVLCDERGAERARLGLGTDGASALWLTAPGGASRVITGQEGDRSLAVLSAHEERKTSAGTRR